MIKIIKSGKKTYTIKCKCGCIFSFEEEDIKDIHMNDYLNGDFINETVVYCPECRKPNNVYIKDLVIEVKEDEQRISRSVGKN